MSHDLRLSIFWAVHLALLGLFALEMAWILAAALGARLPGLPADAARRRKLGAVLSRGARLLLSRRLWPLLRRLIAEGLVHRQMALHRRRWLTHLAVLSAWLALGLLSITTGFVVEILPRLGLTPDQVAALPLLGGLFHADVWWVALLNELLGLLALAGMALVVYRRVIERDLRLRAFPGDGLVLALLTFIAFSGFPTETFRLLADYTLPGGLFAPAPGLIPPERLPPVLYGAWGPQWGFVGYQAARALGALHLPAEVWAVWHSLFFWLHFAAVSFLLFALPFTRFAHALFAPLVVAYNGLEQGWAGLKLAQPVRDTASSAADQVPGTLSVDLAHFTLGQLAELEACTRCGECIAACPTFVAAGDEEIHPLTKIARARRFWKADHLGGLARLWGLRPPDDEARAAFAQGVYQCTLCAQCRVVCPVRIDTRPLWIALREQLVDWGLYPPAFDALRRSVLEQRNIAAEDNAHRLLWTENMDPAPQGLDRRAGAETVYFVGCVAAFYPRAYGIPRSFVRLLAHAGEAVTTLGGEEWCCGFPLHIAGMGRRAEELARHNVEAVASLGARRLVTTCPSCYHTWRREYPRWLGEPLPFQVVHAVELLDELLDEGRLRLGPLARRVTYHDPCDLGRTGGIYEAPRRLLRAIPGLELVEMADNREQALCCGGGGDAEMGYPELTAAVGKRRIEQAQAVEAQIIASACQQCKRTLAEAARRNRVRIRALDVVELLWQSVENGGW